MNKEERKAYNKEWNEKNKEWRKKYREEHRDAISKDAKVYRQENKEKIKDYTKKYRQDKKKERREYLKKWRQQNPEKNDEINREWQLARYGVTGEWYEAQMVAQGGKCAICGTTEPGKGRRSKYMCVDHDHETGRVRGLLCHKCNLALGLFASSQNLQKAQEYLAAELCGSLGTPAL